MLALGGCGSGSGAGAGSAATATAEPAQAARYTAAEVAKLARFTKAPDGEGWVNLTGCRVTKILTTHAEVVENRPDADAFVVTNPADDIGVVFVPGTQCREALTANLTLVK